MKISKLPLKKRVVLAYTVLGFVLSVMFAAATVLITEDYEQVIIEQLMLSQADISTGGELNMVVNPNIKDSALQRFISKNGDLSKVPASLRLLPVGIQAFISESGREFQVGIFEKGRDRVYVIVDLKNIDALEDRLNSVLLAIVVFGTAISSWLGWMWAARTVAPVTRLASVVDTLPNHAIETNLKLNFGDDELGRLATAIDHYQARLVQAKEQERVFFADASHELRTPMAIVRGVVDVMSDDENADREQRRRLRRLERGMSDLTDKADAMFILARQSFDAEETIDLSGLMTECLDDLQMHLPESTLVEISLMTKQSFRAPPRQAQLVIRTFLRSMVASESLERLSIVAEGLVVEIHASSLPTARHVSTIKKSNLHLEKTLIGRLAIALGWQVRGFIAGTEKSIEIIIG